MFTVTFPLQKISVEVEAGTTVLEAEIAAGILPDAPCGGRGICGKCRVDLLFEQGRKENVQACRTKVNRDLSVLVSPSGISGILTDYSGNIFETDPYIRMLELDVEKPSLKNPTSDWERLKKAVLLSGGPEIFPDPLSASGLHKTLKEKNFKVTAVLYHNELLSLKKPGRLLTAAVDIGTTTVVLYLADQNTGELLLSLGTMNPQAQYGADVISRAEYAIEHSTEEPARLIRSAVNRLIEEALQKTGNAVDDLYSVFIAGNTCMHHLFLNIDPSGLVHAPYVPSVSDAMVLSAADYGILANPRAKLFMLPCIAGFVGSDTTSVMLLCDFDQREELTLAIDIGTNGEIVLGNRHRFITCSTAAGPAFEGAKITFGMRGQTGAIDHAKIENGSLLYTVIGGGKPEGICGSGLLDLTAALLSSGVIDDTGMLADPEDLPNLSEPLGKRICTIDSLRCFIIADESESENGGLIYLSQKDIREIQLAKAAIASGISLLLKAYGCRCSDIQKVLIAGAFGNYMSPDSSCAIGLIPRELISKIEPVGNGAGSGALKAALNETCFNRAVNIASRAEFLELAADPDFQDCFVDELSFP